MSQGAFPVPWLSAEYLTMNPRNKHILTNDRSWTRKQWENAWGKARQRQFACPEYMAKIDAVEGISGLDNIASGLIIQKMRWDWYISKPITDRLAQDRLADDLINEILAEEAI